MRLRHPEFSWPVSTRQQGMIMIVMTLILLLAASVAFFEGMDGYQYKVMRQQKTLDALAEAKAALIGWSVAHAQYPGILPFPDRNSDKNYDGQSDCVSNEATLDYSHLLGKLPYLAQTNPCVGTGAGTYGLSENLMDAEGERLWYAVSRNLVRPSSNSVVINPGIADAPTYPWLQVRDKSGRLISDRVAAVVISAGPVLGSQSRAGGIAGPAAYLDSITIQGVAYSNASYEVANEVFISGEASDRLSSEKQTEFNDTLVFITIDELLAALQNRAMGEAVNALRSYYAASAVNATARFFPYAALLSDTTHACQESNLSGSLPLLNNNCSHPNPLVTLPAWFAESRWQDYLKYEFTTDCSYATPGCSSGGVAQISNLNNSRIVKVTP
jgi:hypothetical protein